MLVPAACEGCGISFSDFSMLAWIVGLYEVEEDAKRRRRKHPEWDDATWHAYRDLIA